MRRHEKVQSSQQRNLITDLPLAKPPFGYPARGNQLFTAHVKAGKPSAVMKLGARLDLVGCQAPLKRSRVSSTSRWRGSTCPLNPGIHQLDSCRRTAQQNAVDLSGNALRFIIGDNVEFVRSRITGHIHAVRNKGSSERHGIFANAQFVSVDTARKRVHGFKKAVGELGCRVLINLLRCSICSTCPCSSVRLCRPLPTPRPGRASRKSR